MNNGEYLIIYLAVPRDFHFVNRAEVIWTIHFREGPRCNPGPSLDL